MNLSDRFRQHFEKVHNSARTAMANRKADFKKERKAKKDDMAFARRNIDFNNMSPCTTPSATPHCPKPSQKKTDCSKRLEMLAKWKEEKAKKKLEDNSKKKPVFKVYHVSPTRNGCDVVNRLLQQREILSAGVRNAKFAPENHKFRAPVGVKPLDFDFVRSKAKVEKSSTSTPGTTPGLSRLRQPKPEEPAKRPLNQVKKIPLPRQTNSRTSSTTKAPVKNPPLNQRVKTPLLTNLNKSKLTPSTSNNPPAAKPTTRVKTPLLPNLSRSKLTPSTSNNLPAAKPSTTSNQRIKTPLLPSSNKSKLTRSTSKGTFTPKRNLRTRKTDKVDGPTISTNLVEKAKNTEVSKTISSNESSSNSKKSEHVQKDTRSEPVRKVKNISKKTNDLKNGKANQADEENDKSAVEKVHKAKKTPSKLNMSKSLLSRKSVGATPKVDTHSNCNEKVELALMSPTYISPFVTISRGKRSARDEFNIRNLNSSINTDTPEKTGILSQYTTPTAGASYFLVKLDNEIEKLKANYQKWEECRQDPDLTEEARCLIDVTVGQSKLLIKEKFEQFRGLIMQVKTKKYEENVITCEDLHGFWDMIYMQVIDLDTKYADLEKLKENNWQETLPSTSPIKPKKLPVKKKVPKKTAANSRLKDLIKAAREKQKAGVTDKHEEGKSFDGGYYKVTTPLKDTQQKTESSGTKRKSLRVSILSQKNGKRTSSSPGLAMMKLSQSIKHNNGLTPAKSILKPERCVSTGKKSVAFVTPLRNMVKVNLHDETEKKSENVIVRPVRRSLGFDYCMQKSSVQNNNCSLSESEKENTPLRRSARLAK